jgi:hypothetical protein
MLTAAFACSAAAQRNGRLEFGLALRQWESADTTTLEVSQIAVPIRLDLPLGSRFGLTLKSNPGRTVLDAADEELTAVGNVVLKTSWYALDQTLLLRAGCSVPTASTRLSQEELPIAALVASDELGFAMDSPIDGFSATAGIAVARPWGENTLAGGIGYSVRARYQPYEDSDEELDPGEELVFTAGLYRRVSVGSAPALLKTDVAVVVYGSDLWEGDELRRLGPRTDIRGLLTIYPRLFDPVEVRMWARFRAAGKADSDAGLVDEDANSFGPEGALRLRVGYVIAPWLKAEATGFLRIEGNNGYGSGGGRVFGASIGPRLRLGRQTTLTIDGGTLSGTAWTTSGETDISGLEVRSVLARTW